MTQHTTSVRLSARDEEDLMVISMLLQDAIVLASEIRWDGNRQTLGFTAQRYTWDRAGTGDPSCGRINSHVTLTGAGGIAIQNIAAAEATGNASGHPALSLLAVRFADGESFLEFDFAGSAALRVTVNEGWTLHLADQGEPWSAPCPAGHALD